MAIKKGHSQEIVSGNVRELVRAGHKPKHAVAMAISAARKHKKMSSNGVVENDDSEIEMPIPVYGLDEDDEGLSEGVEDMGPFAEALQKSKYSANNNSVSYDSNSPVHGHKMHEKEEEQPELSGPDPVGLKPEVYGNGGAEDKHAELSEDAKMAIMARKKKRRFS